MRKITFLITSLLMITMSTKAQSYANAFAGNIGIVQDGIGGVFSYNYFLDRHDFIDAGVLLTAANFKYVNGIKIPYNDFTLNLGYSKNVFWNYKNTFNVNIGAGGVFGYETVNKGDKELSNGAVIRSEPGFIYGAYIGVDFDYAITDRYSITLRANEYYHANSDLGEFMPFLGLGFRYYAN
ncbi:conjugal transfer protein TraO [Flavobacterium sp. GSB-24]|uniref:conjugal transfer protein TraO n=1 Tax=Flavobacterium sp. GSB-24 TaxID=2994319 RepID=UPI0024911B19|nr:conjugal transfer protein TraO [Flavobacterium sp. GSB-24]